MCVYSNFVLKLGPIIICMLMCYVMSVSALSVYDHDDKLNVYDYFERIVAFGVLVHTLCVMMYCSR